MANMRAIRTRIRSIENTRQITKSMKMVAASKLRHVQTGRENACAFADKSCEMLNSLLSGSTVFENPFLQERAEINKTVYVLFVGNRGLCGMYNSSLLRYLEELVGEDTEGAALVVCGRWGSEHIAASGLKVLRRFDDISDTPKDSDAAPVVEYLRQLYLDGEADRIVLVYQGFKSVLSQSPTTKQLLPVKAESSSELKGDFIFEPDRASIVAKLVDLYIQSNIYATMVEARAGEHASRMTAMTAASDNTSELIAKLNLQLNHARQAAITTEISEIVGGAAALNQQ